MKTHNHFRMLKVVLLLALFFATLLVKAQFQVPNYSSLELTQEVAEHLTFVQDNSGFFGLSKSNITVEGESFKVGSVTVTSNNGEGQAFYGNQVIDIDSESVKVSVKAPGGAAVAVSVNKSALQGGPVTSVTFAGEADLGLGEVFTSVVDQIPVPGLSSSQAISAIETFLNHVSGTVGGKVKVKLEPVTATHRMFTIQLETEVLAGVKLSTSGRNGLPGKLGNVKTGIASAKTVRQKRSFEASWPHIEALTGIRLPDAVRSTLDPNYGPKHPFASGGDGVYFADLDGTYTFGNISIKGTGADGQPISASSETTGTQQFFMASELGDTFSGETLALAVDLDEGYSDWATLVLGDEPIEGIGIAPFDIAGGAFGGAHNISENNYFETTVASLPLETTGIPMLDSYDGVDFTNLRVSAIDVDDATKAVNFILRGDRVASSNGPNNLTGESKLLKDVFLETLCIPNNAQFVSLETNPPEAVAYEPFKHTQMGQIFFKADEKMKKDFARIVYENPGGVNLPQQWYNQLDAISNPSGFLTTLLNRGIIPAISFSIRANIIPVVPNGNKEGGQVFINDASYDIIITDAVASVDLINVNGGDITITQQELQILAENIDSFDSHLITQANSAKNQIISSINAGTGSEYRDLKRILPAIITGQWYKQSGLADGTLKDIIDTGDLSSVYTGYSLSKPFDQALWNSKAFQLLESFDINTAGGYAFTTEVLGGVTIDENVSANNLTNTLSNVQQIVLDESLTEGYNSDNYVNAGGVSYQIAELVPVSLQIKPNAKNLIGFNGELIENRPAEIAIGLANNGNKAASNVLVRVFAKKANQNPVEIESITISSIQPYETKVHRFTYNPGATSGNDVIEDDLELYFTVNENEAVPELSYSNNRSRTRNILLNYIIYEKDPQVRQYQFDLASSPDTYFSANEQAEFASVIRSGAKLSAHATEKIVLRPGFKTENGGYFKAWIGTDLEAIEEYNRLVPANSSANARKTYAAATPVQKVRKAPKLAVDNRLESVKERNFAKGEFSEPEIRNYEIVNELSESSGTFRLYPNPSSEIVHVEFELSADDDLAISVHDLSGKEIEDLRSVQTFTKGFQKLSLEIDHIPNGLYMLVIEGEHVKETKLFMKK